MYCLAQYTFQLLYKCTQRMRAKKRYTEKKPYLQIEQKQQQQQRKLCVVNVCALLYCLCFIIYAYWAFGFVGLPMRSQQKCMFIIEWIEKIVHSNKFLDCLFSLSISIYFSRFLIYDSTRYIRSTKRIRFFHSLLVYGAIKLVYSIQRALEKNMLTWR